MPERRVALTGPAFLVLTFAFSALSLWLLARGYVSDFALHRWAKALVFADVGEMRIENIGLLYPHAPIYLLAFASWLPGLHSAHLPYLLAALAAAATLALWNHHLAHKGYGRSRRWALLALAATHPMLLWAVTSGMHNALTLLVFYLFAWGCVRIAQLRDVRSIIFVGVVMVLLFFTDERTGYIFAALLPLVPFLAPRRLVLESPLSAYVLIAFPLAVAVVAWVYLNWIFHADPWLFLSATESSFRGAWNEVQAQPWLQFAGGGWLAPFGVGVVLGAACFPAPLWLAWRFRRHRRALRTVLVLFAHLLVALAMASADYFLSHPASILFLLGAVAMAAVLLVPRLADADFRTLVGLMLAGNLAAAALMSLDDSAEVADWRSTLAGGPPRAEQFAADQRLGRWLADHRLPTLIDDRVAYRAIVARGDAKDLLLPFDSRFKLELKRRAPEVPQLAMVDPRHPAAAQDRIAQRYPDLFASGLPGYVLAYDRDHWRVWRREP